MLRVRTHHARHQLACVLHRLRLGASGTSGAIVALLASSIPCAILVAVLTALFSYWQDSPFAQGAIHGAVAAAVGITVKTCWTIAKPYFKGTGRLRVIVIGTAAFLLYVAAGIPPIEVLILAGVVGAFLPVHSNAPTHWRPMP